MSPLRLFIYSLITRFIPPTRCFGFKRWLLRWAGAEIGDNVRICSSVNIVGNGTLTIGDNTWIGHESFIMCSSNVYIGADCDIAPRVYIGNGTHQITPDLQRIAGLDVNKDIKIENGVWLCVNTVILPGVTIGRKSVIAAGGVVTKSISEYSLAAGCPAIVKKNYD